MNLPQDAAGHTPEMIERALQDMRDGNESSNASSTLPAEYITFLIGNTVAVMTGIPQHRAEWREKIARVLIEAPQSGTDWQIEVEFFTALLAILDGQEPSLPADHLYAAPIAAIQERIAKGKTVTGGEEDVSKEA